MRRLLEHELGLIAELGYEPYFLTVHDLVRFARSRGILCQGRGSAYLLNKQIDPGPYNPFEKQGLIEFPEFVGKQVVTVRVSDLLNGVDLEAQRKRSFETVSRACSVFFSYSHKDESLRDELETHLKLLQRQGVISTWHDRKILPGSEWDHDIDRNLNGADIVLLLVSADFLASDYCWDNEVRRAIERHENGEATAIPVMLRACDWTGSPFAKIQGLPTNMSPIAASADRDASWTDVAKGIRAAAECRRSK